MQQGHADEKPVGDLLKVVGPGIGIALGGDAIDPGDWVHDDGPLADQPHHLRVDSKCLPCRAVSRGLVVLGQVGLVDHSRLLQGIVQLRARSMNLLKLDLMAAKIFQ